MDIRLQHLRELTTQIDKINQEKANQNTSDSEVAERPFDDSNRYKIQNVYDNLAKRGELQHRMRVRIEQFFEKKLEQYNICDFSSSAKLGLEITKLLSYIPNQLKPDYDYKQRFESIRADKLRRVREQLDKLKGQQINPNSLNEIIYKYHQFAINQSLDMKEEVFAMIKTEITTMANQVTQANGNMQRMIETA